MAAVKSVEEKGFLLDIGSSTISGFLPFEKADRLSAANTLVGQSFPCSVVKPSDGRVLQLTRNLKTPVIIDQEHTKLRQLLPGSVIQGTVEKIVGSGVYLRFGKEGTYRYP